MARPPDDLRKTISIHSPRMGRDKTTTIIITQKQKISIHSPRMGRDQNEMTQAIMLGISIHSPRMGRD